jgi:uncharacterized protein
MGLQFENLVINNFKSLFFLLNIPYEEIVFAGPFFQKQRKKERGTQIDYLVQLKYNCLYLCEIKYSKKPIGKEIIDEVQKKMERLKLPKVPFSLRPVLIHVNGVSDEVQRSSFFTHIIDFSRFLN